MPPPCRPPIAVYSFIISFGRFGRRLNHFAGTNLLEGIVDFWYAEDYPEVTAGGAILDVRTWFEFQDGHIPGAVHLPLHQLRRRLAELEELKGRPVYVYCLSGVRSYIAGRMLMQSGFKQVFNLSGGILTFHSGRL